MTEPVFSTHSDTLADKIDPETAERLKRTADTRPAQRDGKPARKRKHRHDKHRNDGLTREDYVGYINALADMLDYRAAEIASTLHEYAEDARGVAQNLDDESWN